MNSLQHDCTALNLMDAELHGRPGTRPLDREEFRRIVAKIGEVACEGEWRTLTELVQRTPLAQLNFLVENRLLNADAQAYAAAVIRKVGCNDLFGWKLCPEPVTRETADWLVSNLAWDRAGNAVMQTDHTSTDYPAWSMDEPAYTGHQYRLTVAVIDEPAGR